MSTQKSILNSDLEIILGFLVSLLVLSILIFFHELGHFIAARAFGVRVEVFSIGFGKKLFSITKGNTEYAFSMIPLGGYVKMKGQNDTNPKEVSTDDDSYGGKGPLKRMIILLAGPMFNLILATVIYFALAISGIDTLTAKIGQIQPNSAAASADIQTNDRVVAINGEEIKYWHEISEKIQKVGGNEMRLILENNGSFRSVKLRPLIVQTKNIFGENTTRYMIGISPKGESTKVYYNPLEAAKIAIEKTYDSAKFIALGIEKLVTGVLGLNNVGGVISIFQATSDATHTGFTTLLLLTALISVNLGVINLLPIPALDGGHILFNLYELIFKKAPSEAVFTKLTFAGWAILLWLMLLGLYNDLTRIVGGF
jgi:regulator of sigma E protease